jgi:hypothetical protein
MPYRASKDAVLVLAEKQLLDDGAIIEIKVWKLPEPTVERPHGFKYSLFFGRNGRRLVGYDNEKGKGDHRHYGRREEPYVFVSLEKLINDFQADILARDD